MVFSTTNLFKGVACPAGTGCMLTNCVFAHDAPLELAAKTAPPSAQTAQPGSISRDTAEPAMKRRKITYDSLADKPPSKADLIKSQLAAVKSVKSGVASSDKQNAQSSAKSPATLKKSVSPPPQTNAKIAKTTTSTHTTANNTNLQPTSATVATTEAETAEGLNPRLIPNDPAGHQKRLVFLKLLHAEMVRLNKKVRETATPDVAPLVVLTEQAIIKMCLDEEEKCAREQPSVYGNVIKQRISSLRKMADDDWVIHVKTVHAKPKPLPEKKDKAPKKIVTGLEPDQEPLILPHLVADQSKLTPYGYIPVPPSLEDAARCAAAVEASGNYETCERCLTRFQMFPDRNEDGALTSGGACHYHPNRLVTPPYSKGDHELAPKEKYFPCCNEKAGYPGCTVGEDHVFKTTSPGRLAAILPFVTTPENPSPATDKQGNISPAVTFDCEMGYTAYGLELIRLTAVSWPSGEELLDILVRPIGAIIDLNSRFSGIFPDHFTNAIPYDQWKASPSSTSDGSILPIVDHPKRARELLCSFLTPSTPLMGHAIDNDLNTVRLCHPTIVDTVLCFPHPRGLPYRLGLRMLTQRHLGRTIQTGGDRGHDSLEDARATGDLVRVKVGALWKKMRIDGWTIEDGKLVAPVKLAMPIDGHAATGDLDGASANGAGRKRKKEVMTDDSSADEAKQGGETKDTAIGRL